LVRKSPPFQIGRGRYIGAVLKNASTRAEFDVVIISECLLIQRQTLPLTTGHGATTSCESDATAIKFPIEIALSRENNAFSLWMTTTM
jgi:hypothetical protein